MSEAAWKPTACILCECNCGLEVQLGGADGRRLVRFRGDKRHPSSRGYACEKPHRLDHYQNGRDRIRSPLRRRADGSFEEIDWDTAIREVAERFSALRAAHGGESILYYGGGGQGNHLPGAYASATRRALGSRYRSSALAQEKTGEFWVCDRTFGGMTRADFEHCEVALFLGKNPWFSHSIPRARVTLKEIARDPARTLIVVDPRRSETAEIADIHLQVKPGSDVWLLLALLAVIVEEQLIDREFLAAYADAGGVESVLEALRKVDIASACERCGVDEASVRRSADIIGRASSLASFEDLGVQQNRDSTLVSYLHRLLLGLTGNLDKRGSHYLPVTLSGFISGASKRRSPVAGAPIISGLIPCNVIASEILTDHPQRYRGMLVESANPAHSVADSKRMREAMAALDTLVVIDVAMTETARLAHYVLPAATQFEKAEATFFNFEFPENYFHLRPRLFAPPEGPLPEAEIHARLVEALGALNMQQLEPLRAAARAGRKAFVEAFAPLMADPQFAGIAPVILYRTLELPEELREGAVVLGLCVRFALENPQSLARAGFSGEPLTAAVELFDAILQKPSGVVFSVDVWGERRQRIAASGEKLQLALPELLEELARVMQTPREPRGDSAFPFLLSAGERRSFTANTIIRDPSWRKKDAEGALRISAEDAAALGLQSGDSVRLSTRAGTAVVPVDVSDSMQRGHIALPNGLGLAYPDASEDVVTGVAPNELTSTDDCDRFVGTPWHKTVPARLERVAH